MNNRERKSEAVEPGRMIGVGTGSTPVLDADDADLAVKFFITNESDTEITLTYGASANPGSGLILQPSAVLEEADYAGAMSAVHRGTGTKFLGLTIV